MSSFFHWLMEKEWGSQSGSSHFQGFFINVYTNLKSFRTSYDTQASLLSITNGHLLFVMGALIL